MASSAPDWLNGAPAILRWPPDCEHPKRRRRRRRRRVQGLERRGRLTAMTMIADRPEEVADRIQVGHWEGNCIMGAGNRSAIGTLVERRTRFLILIHVPTGRPTAEAMGEGIIAALGQLPAKLRRTLTWDQGKELAMHQQISEQTGTRVFFCDAHSPWQRGSNENMNGLLRDYFPKWDRIVVDADDYATGPSLRHRTRAHGADGAKAGAKGGGDLSS